MTTVHINPGTGKKGYYTVKTGKSVSIFLVLLALSSCGISPQINGQGAGSNTPESVPPAQLGGPSNAGPLDSPTEPNVSPVAIPEPRQCPVPLSTNMPATRKLIADTALVEYWLNGGTDFGRFLEMPITNENGETVPMQKFLEGASSTSLRYNIALTGDIPPPDVVVFPQIGEYGKEFRDTVASPDDIPWMSCEIAAGILIQLGSSCLGTYITDGPGVVVGLSSSSPTYFFWKMGGRIFEAEALLAWFITHCGNTQYRAELLPEGDAVRVWVEPPYAEYCLIGIAVIGGGIVLLPLAPEAAAFSAGAAVAFPAVSRALP